MTWRSLIPLFVLTLALGCGPRGPRVSQLDVSRASWDTLHVTVHFEVRGGLGRRVAPLDRRLVLFDAAYDTLYAGADTLIVVPDSELADSEALLVEACGRFPESTVCEQRTVTASPKRVQSDIVLTFPEDTGFARGSYRVKPTIERRVFGAEDAWEALERTRPYSLSAVVRVAGAAPSGVAVALNSRRGRFNLARRDGYRDFRYYLRSQMRDLGAAQVAFDLFADLGNGAIPAGTVVQPVRMKSQEEQVQELGVLVDRAGRLLIGRLRGFLGVRRRLVFINNWSYRPADGRYEAEIELHWRNAGSGIWHELVGRLDVSEDGSETRFRYIRGNRAGRERWERENNGPSIELGNLTETEDRSEP